MIKRIVQCTHNMDHPAGQNWLTFESPALTWPWRESSTVAASVHDAAAAAAAAVVTADSTDGWSPASCVL